jgi:Ni,Fe-hydrogenase maturation factor
LHPIEPLVGGQILAHATDPRSLLSLSGQLFGHSPKAWVLGIPVEDFGFGDGLSLRAEAGLQAAIKAIQKLAGELI